MFGTAEDLRKSNLIDFSQWPILIEDFISKNELDVIFSFVKNNQSLWPDLNPKDYWAGRSLHFDRINDSSVKQVMTDSVNKILNVIQDITGLINLYPDLLSITRWPSGYELLPHADGENPDQSYHPLNWRLFGSVIYINQDYRGGELYYPSRNLLVQPKLGMLAAHPGTIDFLHGVRPVTQGVRYTITSFFTHDKNHALKYD